MCLLLDSRFCCMKFGIEEWIRDRQKKIVSQETMRRRTYEQRLEIALSIKRRKIKLFLEKGFDQKGGERCR
ncbi:hypothetical protein F7O85_05905 [Vibrio panuliri]|uniref:Transposase n=1 Tax=Vibrio panuliri TaxID=1381081 RepID=A0ABX3F9Q5_9VIBR|nr:hypothetical protein F7O85_05905 [Vibrio panuliri]OLQ85969.1 hypothetical protein BIY20_15700 [Vibrio panuliri]